MMAINPVTILIGSMLLGEGIDKVMGILNQKEMVGLQKEQMANAVEMVRAEIEAKKKASEMTSAEFSKRTKEERQRQLESEQRGQEYGREMSMMDMAFREQEGAKAREFSSRENALSRQAESDRQKEGLRYNLASQVMNTNVRPDMSEYVAMANILATGLF